MAPGFSSKQYAYINLLNSISAHYSPILQMSRLWLENPLTAVSLGLAGKVKVTRKQLFAKTSYISSHFEN